MTSAPMSSRLHYRVRVVAFATGFLEALPQLAIQIYVATIAGWSPITILTIASGIVFMCMLSPLWRHEEDTKNLRSRVQPSTHDAPAGHPRGNDYHKRKRTRSNYVPHSCPPQAER